MIVSYNVDKEGHITRVNIDGRGGADSGLERSPRKRKVGYCDQ